LENGLFIILYASLLYIGIRYLLVKRALGRDMLSYVFWMGWCAYLTIGGINNWPPLSLITPIISLFQPAGKWIEQLMGGPPSE
jgi:hypothetical protein